MPDTPDAVSVTDKSRPRFRMGCTGFSVCMFILLVLAWVGVKMGSVRALNSAEDALRAAGEPVTWEEVIASIKPIPDEENSALVLLPHLASLGAWSSKPAGDVLVSRSDISLGVRRSEDTVKLMRKCINDNRTNLIVLHDTAKCPSGRWPVDSNSRVARGAYEHLANTRSCARFLSVEAELHASEGDGHGAALSVRAMRRLAASLDETPDLIGLLVRIACGAICVNAAECALGMTEMPAEDLAMLRDEFAAEAERLRLHMALRGERAELIRQVMTGRRESFDMLNRSKAAYAVHCIVPGVPEMDALFGLTHMSKLIDMQDLPLREQLADVKTVLADVDLAARGQKVKAFFYLTPSVMPAMGRVHESLVRAKLRMHIARTALAAEQFRMERGDWPDKLTDLVPDYIDAVAQDWFAPAGTPLSYAQTPVGVRVWARGGDNAAGLAHGGGSGLRGGLLWPIAKFADREGRLPKSLDELLESPDDFLPFDPRIPLDPRTGKPYSYVTNPANPSLFILDDFTDGMTETEFWKQKMSTRQWAERHRSPAQAVVFRLLNPKLRGATQSTFGADVRASSHLEDLHALGYTAERLEKLGFSKSTVDYFKDIVEEIKREEAERKVRQKASAPEVPPDTQAAVTPNP